MCIASVGGKGHPNSVCYTACLAADNGQVVTMAHLLHGARRELQKMGRMVGGEEFSAASPVH